MSQPSFIYVVSFFIANLTFIKIYHVMSLQQTRLFPLFLEYLIIVLGDITNEKSDCCLGFA